MLSENLTPANGDRGAPSNVVPFVAAPAQGSSCSLGTVVSASANWSFPDLNALRAFVAPLAARDAARFPAVTRSSARALTAGEATLPQTKVDWALWCAGRGLRVFPAKWVSPSTKKPLIVGWQQLATVDPDQIREWWAKRPDADIGILLGQGILVIDIDVKKSKPGLESLAKLGIKLDDTLCNQTWSGGCHQFYMDPDRYTNSGGFLPGLDCKSDGGMVLGPGSHGGLYKLLHDKPIAPLPEALKRHLTRAKDIQPPRQFVDLDEPENVEAAIRWLREEAPIAVQDCNGNDQLYKVACELMRDGAISEDTARELILKYYDPRCKPSWAEIGDWKDFNDTFYSASEHAKGDIGTKTRKGLFGDNIKPAPQPALPTHTSPAALVDDGGLITTRASQVVRKPQEWLIPGKIPYGAATLWAGHPKIGKSLSLMKFIASFTNRVPVPVTHEVLSPVDVLLFSKEQTKDTITGQAIAAGASLDRLHIVEGVPIPDSGKRMRKRFDIKADVGRIEDYVRANPQVRVVIFDPVLAYVNGRTETNNAVAVRDAVEDLIDLAAELGFALILVMHLNKAIIEGAPAWTQISGSGAWVATCRMAYLALKDKDDPKRRLILCAANSLSADESGYALQTPQ